jgi:hypothetical protein
MVAYAHNDPIASVGGVAFLYPELGPGAFDLYVVLIFSGVGSPFEHR